MQSLSLVRPAGIFSPSYLIPFYTLLIVITFSLLFGGFCTTKGNELSRERSLFAAVSAATLTGFTTSTNVNDYNLFGRMLMLGITIAGILFSFIAGGTAVSRIARLRYSDSEIATFSCMTVATVIVFCSIPLRFIGDGLGFFDAIFQSVSAFGNSGLYLGPAPGSQAIATHLILLPLALFGGLGITVLMELIDWIRTQQPLSFHGRKVLLWTAGVYLVGTALLFVSQLSKNISNEQLRVAILWASHAAVDTRSLGFPFKLPANAVLVWLMMGLMILGANSGGTGGGLKLTTLSVLTRGTRQSLGGTAPGRIFGIAIVWAAIYILMIAVTQLLLLSSDSQISADRLLFLSISAIGNVGLSHDPVALSDPGLTTISAAMLAGRVAPIMILWWAADTCSEMSEAVG